jgi:hypothetical protein
VAGSERGGSAARLQAAASTAALARSDVKHPLLFFFSRLLPFDFGICANIFCQNSPLITILMRMIKLRLKLLTF